MKLPQTTGFVNQAGGEVSLAKTSPDEQVAAAENVIRHAVSLADAEMLMEMIGLDIPPARMTCPRCTRAMGTIAHLNRCEPQTLDNRLRALADAIGARP